MAEPVRSCVGCRRRHPARALMRLQVDAEGNLSPVRGAGSGGRSAWVCPQARCVQRIQKNPKGLFRALRRKPAPAVGGLQERLRAHLDEEAARLLARCHREGLVVSGRGRLRAAGGLVALVTATDASPESVRQVREAHETLVCAQIGLDRAALGALIGRADRAVAGVQAGRSSQLLCECLQRRLHLS